MAGNYQKLLIINNNMSKAEKRIIVDGPHVSEVARILLEEIKNPAAIESIREKACHILESSVDPIAGEPTEPSDGLLYGLIQSGKTSVMTTAAAMAADNGFQFILILTSNYDPLYEQTLERTKKVLRGIRIFGKDGWKDQALFDRQIRTTPFAIVCSKGVLLEGMLQAFKKSGAKGLSTFIIDDEADQASLNTQASKGSGDISRTNALITAFRTFFPVNTYLQVTATPQALFLQRPGHKYRPSFTVLSEPGAGYVGGEKFFDDSEDLLEYVDLEEVEELHSSHQPLPTAKIPIGLKRSLNMFFVGATAAIIKNPTGEGYSYLCHISHTKVKHDYLVSLIERFKEETINNLGNKALSGYEENIAELKEEYDRLNVTEPDMPAFNQIVDKIKFYLPAASVKEINANSNDDVKIDSVYNVFVGGNKLGRGVTIKNLLISYYGRNPRIPNSDTVLQHARMYGYRTKYLGLTRLFLPEKLAEHFRLIHRMEKALRGLIEIHPKGNFEGIYISDPLRATRKNILEPNSIGLYAAGSSVNPKYPLRNKDGEAATLEIDRMLASYNEDGKCYKVTTDIIINLIKACKQDLSLEPELWSEKNLQSALEKLKILRGEGGYLVVKRGRGLNTAQKRDARNSGQWREQTGARRRHYIVYI